MKNSTAPVLYREVQRFRQVWLWGLLAVFSGVMLWGFVQQILFDRPWGTNPAPDAVLWVLLLMAVGLPAFFAALHLKVEVRPGALHVRFFPFVRKAIPVAEIAECEPRVYRPIAEYGGWGVRYGFSRGWAYNVSGNRGVQLRLSNGKLLLLGSQRPEELAAALRQAR